MKNTIKGGIAALGIAGAMAAGIGAGTANATSGQDNYEFIQMLNNDQIYITDLSQILANAHQVCYHVADNGATGTSETSRVYYSYGTFTWQGARSFVWDSVTVFCPQFLPGGSQNPLPGSNV